MRSGTRVFFGLIACVFTAGNLLVSVSAAAAPAASTSAGPAPGNTRANSVRQPKSIEAVPQFVDIRTLPSAPKMAKPEVTNRPLRVHDPKAYDEAKRSPHGRAGNQTNAELFGCACEKLLSRSAIRLRDGVRVHAEAGGEHFGQHNERILPGRSRGQQATDSVEVRLFIFPLDVELKGDDVHLATLSTPLHKCDHVCWMPPILPKNAGFMQAR